MTFLRVVIPLYPLFEHDLRANASRLSRGKTGPHFSGSCSTVFPSCPLAGPAAGAAAQACSGMRAAAIRAAAGRARPVADRLAAAARRVGRAHLVAGSGPAGAAGPAAADPPEA